MWLLQTQEASFTGWGQGATLTPEGWAGTALTPGPASEGSSERSSLRTGLDVTTKSCLQTFPLVRWNANLVLFHLSSEWSAAEFRSISALLGSTKSITYLFRALAPMCRMGVITSNYYWCHEAVKKIKGRKRKSEHLTILWKKHNVIKTAGPRIKESN